MSGKIRYSREDLKAKISRLALSKNALSLQLSELESDLEVHAAAIRLIQIEMDKVVEERKGVGRALGKYISELDGNNFQYKGIQVTEHAIVQYVLRGLGIDPDDLISEMFKGSDEVIKQVGKLGDGKYPMSEGLQGTIVDNTLVTVFNKKEIKK